MTTQFPALRGTRGVVVGLLGALAVTIIAAPAQARHQHGRHGVATSSSEGSSAPYAAIVVDANSGNVLHAANADEPRHPASLTKIMTLYLLFERLEANKLRLDSEMPVSEHASAQSPTKLGLRPDQTIVVEDAIRGLVTKSANDAAVVIAEAIGGDEHEFADMMTRKAHALGMNHTLYRNASGLPNDEQVTTARDQALLGRAIQERFPRYYRYFSTPSFTYHGMEMRNHNHLLGTVEGVDGIKTGYTQASGFNLVTSVRRNNRHIVAVVLGGASAGARDARMRSLIEEYIVAASTQQTATAIAEASSAKEIVKEAVKDTVKDIAKDTAKDKDIGKDLGKDAAKEAAKDSRVAARRPAGRNEAPPTYAVASFGRPVAWPGTPSPTQTSQAQTSPAPDTVATIPTPAAKPAADEPIKPIQVKTVKVKLTHTAALALASTRDAAANENPIIEAVPERAAPPAAPTPRMTAPPPQKPGILGVLPYREVNVATADAKPDAKPDSKYDAGPASPSGVSHQGWIIQVGAFDVERDAKQKLSAAQAKAGPMLARTDAFTEAVIKGDKTFYRARFAGLQKDTAEAACRQLKRNDVACMVIKN